MRISKTELEKMRYNRSHWEAGARKFASSHEVSWGDRNMIKKETDNIRNYIKNGDLILDAGCSNGFSTFEIARGKRIKVRAFDYSPLSIRMAQKGQAKKDPAKKITFYQCNILNIDEKDRTFDAAYTIRVLINLPSWKLQKKAILEIHRALKPGGLYLLSEAFLGGMKNINALRASAGMKPLTTHKFNLYIQERRLEQFIKKYFNLVRISRFSSIYYVGSRFVRYLTMKKADKDSYDNEINNMFAKYPETENSGDFGIQKLYILRKK